MQGKVNLGDERIRIALGALLHDIGKVVQRASENPKEKTHQEFGHDYLLERFNEFGKELALFAKYHHFTGKEKSELDVRSRYEKDLRLVAVADNYSAGEREYRKEKEQEFDLYTPLKSVFSTLEESNAAFYFPPRRLSEGPNFPKTLGVKVQREDYYTLLEEFTLAINKSDFHPNTVLNLMEEFFSFVPSHTLIKDEISTDISLFDHSKTTCAIALALYNYLIETSGKRGIVDVEISEIDNPKDNYFALLLVDISGIQSFIYTVGTRGSLKMLRARSFYIEMLLNFVAKRLLKELNLFDSNVVFLGGGNLTILFQNTENAKKRVEKLLEEINGELWKEHRGRLWLNYALEEFSGEVLLCRGDVRISDVISRLHEKLNVKKFKKFSTLDPKEVFAPIESSGIYECEVCGEDISREEFEGSRRCKKCNDLTDLGKYVHRAKYIAYNPKPSGKFYFEFDLLGGEKLVLSDEPIESEFIWVINPEGEQLHFGTPLYCGNYPGFSRIFKMEESLEAGENPKEVSSKEISDLEFHYVGSELIAALKMDVDNLGYLFSRGLPKISVSLSRLSNLSRFINLFFKHYVNRIASGSVSEYKQFSVLYEGENYPRELVIVYAGGDDLFAVGTWHDIIEFSFDVREMFKRFVGDGIPITLSGGISINHTKFPVQLLAENADEEEKMSKSQIGKNSLTIWSRSMYWEEWKDIAYNFIKPLIRDFYNTPSFSISEVKICEGQSKEESEKIFRVRCVDESGASLSPKKINGVELPRRFIYKLLEISTLTEKFEKEGKFSLKPYSALAYLFGRSEKILRDKNYLLQLLDINKKGFLVKIKPALMWLDYLIR